LPKEGKKIVFAPLLLESRFLNFEASRFFIFFIFGVSPLGVLDSLDPALFGSGAETGNKNIGWGPAL
jgi:hypothetical protein